MQEDLAKQRSSLNSSLTHANGIRRVDFRFEESQDEREEDFPEDGGPFLVFA
jgi:hypothetical protein